jgi:hypothetical protein
MAKRPSKAESFLITTALIIGVPIYAVSKLGESVGWEMLVGAVLVITALVIGYKYFQKRKRREHLMKKYGDQRLVNRLMDGYFWENQTSEQLLDSLGKPADIDVKILKTKKKEIWKYNHRGGNRYGLRITLDNDLVIGWEQKT